ncbi:MULTISPECIES: hypothetical protein [unclassified Erwinia]|uniref:hypothetical protein n=1 Tax=unclassified Erwinia TaxID=2622719 RepID=UPI0006F572F0|nr:MULTISPECIES: hypothetical protein [unclassified Erwinia]KQN57817.1 hypothetical protein ASF13_03200 [Erwinia sp. Leaf53]PLV58916.1 hypothetical protein NV64_13730 [Erwinia sp. B116]
MDELNKRIEQLEKDTHQIRLDVTALTERSKNFATTASVEKLIERCDTFVTKAEFTGTLHAFEVRLNERLDNMDSRHQAMIEKLNSRINSSDSKVFWGIFLPMMTAAITWFVKTAVLQV